MNLLSYARNEVALVMKRHFFLVTPFHLKSFLALMSVEFPNEIFESFLFFLCCWTSVKGNYVCWRTELHSCLHDFSPSDFVQDIQISELHPEFLNTKKWECFLLWSWYGGRGTEPFLKAPLSQMKLKRLGVSRYSTQKTKKQFIQTKFFTKIWFYYQTTAFTWPRKFPKS